MKEYNMDIVVQQTYNCTVRAENEEQAKRIARKRQECRNTVLIDEGVVEVEVVAEEGDDTE